MNLNMKMSTKIGAAFVTLTSLVIVCGIAGYYGVNSLSKSLEYVTGPAWDSADGAMEGSISVQGKMLVIEEIFAGLADKSTVHQEIKAHESSAKEALNRMKEAGLISDANVSRITEAEREYEAVAELVVAEFEAFNAVNKRLADNFYDFEQLMTQAEALGDGLVEALARDPNKTISWNTGLDKKWAAADGAMMSQIGMLKTMYFFRRMTNFEDANNAQAGIKVGMDMLEEASAKMIEHPSFKKGSVPDGAYRGQSYSRALTQAVGKHKGDFAEAIDLFKTYALARDNYEESSMEMLEIL